MKTVRQILILFLVVIASKSLMGQSQQELEDRKQKTLKEIELTNKLLEQTEKSRSAGLNKLLIIKRRITLREQLIADINKEIELLDNTIDEKNIAITKLEQDIKQLKEEYAKMIYYAYKNRNNYDRLMFILSAEDFNQAYRRMKYFQQYSKYRKKQATQITINQKNLEYEIEQLKDKKNEKVELLARKEKERSHLTTEITKENQEVARLKKKERELRNKIKSNQKVMKQLENAIAELIKKEAESNKSSNSLSASEELISEGFKNYKGKLNWPIQNGIIIQEFGTHSHPILKNVKINNEGIDISATKDSKVTAVYEGEVKRVFATLGANMAVIIRHGHYLTLYSNIVNVRVKVGDKISREQHIGDVFYSENNVEGSVLHFRIYEETKVLNPKFWLINR